MSVRICTIYNIIYSIYIYMHFFVLVRALTQSSPVKAKAESLSLAPCGRLKHA